MYLIVWQYQVNAHHIAEFEKIYSPSGTWAELFGRNEGFLETQLLRDVQQPDRYITIDRWASSKDYESFLSQWREEYARLDAQCEGLTEHKVLLGAWESIPGETR